MTCSNGTHDLRPACDVVAGLTCHQQKCQCVLSPDQAWDEQLQACASLEGRGCNLVGDTGSVYDDDYFFHCFSGLECVPIEGHKFEGICRRIDREAEFKH